MADQPTPQEINVNVGSFKGSQYAQIVGVSVTDVDITLEFVYRHPNISIKEAQVIARITMPKQAAIGLAETIYNTNKKHEEKKKGKHG